MFHVEVWPDLVSKQNQFRVIWNAIGCGMFFLSQPRLTLKHGAINLRNMWKSVAGRKRQKHGNRKPDDFYSPSRKNPFIHKISGVRRFTPRAIFTTGNYSTRNINKQKFTHFLARWKVVNDDWCLTNEGASILLTTEMTSAQRSEWFFFHYSFTYTRRKFTARKILMKSGALTRSALSLPLFVLC